VLKKIRKSSVNYLWPGNKLSGGIHLAKWSSIALAKDLGGWGLKDIFPFVKALAGRNLWRLTQGNSMWKRVLISKYFANQTIEDWFHTPSKSSKGSIVWKAIVEAFPLIGNWTI